MEGEWDKRDTNKKITITVIKWSLLIKVLILLKLMSVPIMKLEKD